MVRAFRVGRPQQRLGKAHEGLALCTVERELLEEGIDERPRPLVGSRHLHPTRGTPLGAFESALDRGKRLQQRLNRIGLRAHRGRANRFPQRVHPIPVTRPAHSRSRTDARHVVALAPEMEHSKLCLC